MKMAYTFSQGRGSTDLLLTTVAQRMMSKGFRLAGTVQTNHESTSEGFCDMDVQVLPNGPIVRISQNLGGQARGCRLDPNALELAVFEVEEALQEEVDLLIINKFGKHEATGRGFRSTIAKAMAQDVPVLVGTNALNVKALQEFAEGAAQCMEPDVETLVTWCEQVVPVGVH